MIYNELLPVTVITYTNTIDSYGLSKTAVASTSTSMMTIKPYSNSNVNNPKFNDYELIALTKDNLSCNQCLQFNNKKYDIKHIINSKRWNQLFLVEIK